MSASLHDLPPAAATGAPARIRIWDLPTRLFHIGLALSVTAAIVSAEIGGNAMAWHFRAGYAVLALLGFRAAWGLVGGRWSRFASFLPSPRRVWAVLRGQPAPEDQAGVGHGPLGALSVWALLGLLALQVATGLMADDEIAYQGPLNAHVAARVARLATGWHKDPGAWALFVLIGLHLAAIVFYQRVRRKNLVRPMVTGDAPAPPGTPPSLDGGRQRLLAAVLMAASVAAVLALLRWADAA